jgi:hypothetical protein
MPRRSTVKGQGQPPRRRPNEPDAFDTAFVGALSADFVQHGSGALARLREDDPVSYMKLCAAVLPKTVAGAIDPLEGMTDEELLDRAKGLAKQLGLAVRTDPGSARREKKPQ